MNNRTRLIGLLSGLGGVLLSALLSQSVLAQDLEKRVKAAYIFNFTRFIDWPDSAFASADSPLVVCVASDREIAVTLNSLLAGKQKSGRPLLSSLVLRAEDAEGCHVLYIAADGEQEQRRWLRVPGNRHTLTIADNATFLERGGVVGFALVDGKLRFDISQPHAQGAGLKISSKLLNLARRVHRTATDIDL
ncbi:YfiR family protein [Spongiibacter sp.]|uniref:YfiR family protein n=1 Tax=Spongiibacter sp. TaxID=2024860 RepID=UPI003562D69C